RRGRETLSQSRGTAAEEEQKRSCSDALHLTLLLFLCSDMADPSNRTSTPPSEPAYSAPILGCSPRLSEAILSGRLPLGVNGASGSGAAPHAECRLVEVHGVKVASFMVDGAELICLPQVFELFLKHLVGGLHTVYTKLKRLRISPVVCTVEQVRVLRGLGAIQPGVNRCKLISKADFETLYRDCTSA
ncbi:Dachshund 2, partial [Ataeniobius toweri]|nr:Dachshund 2 [Ataeniobius toweri]